MRLASTAASPRDTALGRQLLAAACELYLWCLLWIAVIGAVLLVTTRLEPVLISSNSMAGLIRAGDVVLIADASPADLAPGKVITFRTPDDRLVTHRVVDASDPEAIVTKGDANAFNDSTPVPGDTVEGVGRVVLPFAGLPTHWIRTGAWFALVAWMAITIAAFETSRRLRRPLPSPGDPEPRPITESAPRARRPWRTAAIVTLGLAVTATAVVSTAETAGARFSASTQNSSNSFAAAATWGDITYVQTLGSSSCGGSATVVTVPAGGVPAGDTVLVRVALIAVNDTATVAATDTRGNTYVLDADAVYPAKARTVVLHAYITTPLQGGDTITVTHPDGKAEAAAADQFANVAAVSPVDAVGTGGNKSNSPTASLVAGTGDVLLYGVVGNRNNLIHTEATGWTSLPAVVTPDCGGARADLYAAYTIAPTPGPYTYQTTLDKTDEWAAAIIAYKP